MSSLVPAPAYSDSQLAALFPADLKLRQVQVLMRHGERTPFTARFTNTGLAKFWPYCGNAGEFADAVLTAIQPGGSPDRWALLHRARQIETFGPHDEPVKATRGISNLCSPAELTDKGRQTTFALGQRLRDLYVTRLGFMPAVLEDKSQVYLRTTAWSRTMASLEQAFSALYPPTARAANLGPVDISVRDPFEETLYPNDTKCQRLDELLKLFGDRAARQWNDSDELAYVSSKIGKWMPERNGGRVRVDGSPRLSGIMDTINSSISHGPEVALPAEFSDPKMREIIDRVAVDEWYTGATISREVRMLGVGPLAGEIVYRLMESVVPDHTGRSAIMGNAKFGMLATHDNTIASFMAALGAFKNRAWPPYTSHLAIELFEEAKPGSRQPGWLSRLMPWFRPATPTRLATVNTDKLSETDRARMDGYYVRLRYNDEVVMLPACAAVANHRAGDQSFCTLAAFKAAVDEFRPVDWRAACRENLGAGLLDVAA